MLIISRKKLESILIEPNDDIDPDTKLGELFRDGPIEIKVFSSGASSVKMGIKAPEQLSIWRRDTA